MMKDYRTLRRFGSDEFIIKKSRFIGYGSPAHSEKDALDFLSSIRAKHRDASHNCWAYIIGENKGIMRYNDDGEPGGTAGLPIIEVMKAQDVTDCIVVVTRYFGGILLGAGGLTRAYTHGAKAALCASGIVSMEPSVRLWAEVAYPLWGRVEYFLKSAPVILEGTEFTATVTATLLVRQKDMDQLEKDLVRVTDAKVELLELERLFYGWDLDTAIDEEVPDE